MTEERLKEIKDSISYAHRISCDPAISMDFRDKEDLYYEVIRLREIIKEATQRVKGTTICGLRAGKGVIGRYLNELLDILNKSNLTLEQLTGVENK